MSSSSCRVPCAPPTSSYKVFCSKRQFLLWRLPNGRLGKVDKKIISLRSSLYDEPLSTAWQIMKVEHILKNAVVSIITFILPRGLYYLQCAVLFWIMAVIMKTFRIILQFRGCPGAGCSKCSVVCVVNVLYHFLELIIKLGT